MRNKNATKMYRNKSRHLKRTSAAQAAAKLQKTKLEIK
jgi:hypothetical protein